MKEKIRVYIKKTFKIDDEELDAKTKYYVKEILNEIRRNNVRLKDMVNQRDRKERDLKFLENSMVSGVSYDNVQAGKNTGGRPNGVLLKIEQQLILEEEIKNQILDIHLLEKSLKDNNQLVIDWLRTIRNKDQSEVLIEKYVNLKDYGSIADDYLYSHEWAWQSASRGIAELARNLKV